MGMTRCFYFVRNTGKDDNFWLNAVNQLASELLEPCTCWYKESFDWIPVFSANICEGCYYPDEDIAGRVQSLFNSPVIVLSVFDSDFSEFSEELPGILCDWGIEREILERLWFEADEVFAEDLLYEVAHLLKTTMVFGHDDDIEDVKKISSTIVIEIPGNETQEELIQKLKDITKQPLGAVDSKELNRVMLKLGKMLGK